MMENKKGIEIVTFEPTGYKPLVDYGEWRVAGLKFCEDLLLENIKTMQKHDETDEVFVLLNGECTLFLAGDGEEPSDIEGIEMEPHKLYNIKKGVWHNHIMNEEGEVLIVENRTTTDDNSPVLPLNETLLKQLEKYRK